MVLKSINSKQKLQRFTHSICLGNVSKDFSIDNMRKTGLFGYVYDFNVDYDVTAIDNILNIYKYLMKKHVIK